MTIVRFNPLYRSFFKPFFEDDEKLPELTMTEGLDVYEEDDEIVVRAALPGVKPEDVEVTFEDGVLHIKGKVNEKEEEKKRRKVVYRMEKVASFDYHTSLPRPVNEKTIEAKVEDGVVTVKAKIAEEAKPRRIPVKTK